jgi:NAD(P)-dependent dehydrogenase (short-subunit alcohol dehydrogenase family)
MVGLESPGESGGSGGSPEAPDGVEVGPVAPGSAGEPSDRSGEVVEFFEEERPLPEAVSLMAQKLDDPGSFGIAEEGDLADLHDEVEQLVERVDQHEKAIGDLTEAVQLLSAFAGDGEPVVRLSPDDFEGITGVSVRNKT